MKTLVAYFSASGKTKKLATTLADVVNGDLFEIRPETPYHLRRLFFVFNGFFLAAGRGERRPPFGR